MTAPAAAPVAAQVVAPALRTPPQATADRLAFAAMLDSLPAAAAKSGSSVAEKGSQTLSDPRRGDGPTTKPKGHSTLDAGGLLLGSPFAPPSSAFMAEVRASQGAEASTAAPAPAKGANLATSGASIAAAVELAKPAAALTGQRTFHLALATSSLAGANSALAADPPAADAPLLAAAAGETGNRPKGQTQLATRARNLTRESAPSSQSASFRTAAPAATPGPASGSSEPPAPAAPRGAASSASQAATPIRAAAQDLIHGGRKSEVAATASARVQGPAPAPAKTDPGDKAADGRPADPAQSTAQPAPQASAFAAPSGAASPSLPGPIDAAAADVTPTASAAPAPAASSIKEIDVDLSPAGLEDVSMTMRLAGDKLSVVVRAASSQTAGSIEGARDAIADRLAAIGQPLDSLIVRQTGANADANANGYGASTDEGSASGGNLAGRSAGGQGGSSDAGSSRRGAYRDRGL